MSRIIKLIHNSLAGYLSNRKELLLNIEKAVRFLILLLLTIHIFACVWIWLGKRESDGWVNRKAYLLRYPERDLDLYIAAIYWVMTTLTTVGYGDFSGNTNRENIFQMIVIFIGIGFFGYIIGNMK